MLWHCSTWQGAFLGQRILNHLAQLNENESLFGKKLCYSPLENSFSFPSFILKALMKNELGMPGLKLFKGYCPLH